MKGILPIFFVLFFVFVFLSTNSYACTVEGFIQDNTNNFLGGYVTGYCEGNTQYRGIWTHIDSSYLLMFCDPFTSCVQCCGAGETIFLNATNTSLNFFGSKILSLSSNAGDSLFANITLTSFSSSWKDPSPVEVVTGTVTTPALPMPESLVPEKLTPESPVETVPPLLSQDVATEKSDDTKKNEVIGQSKKGSIAYIVAIVFIGIIITSIIIFVMKKKKKSFSRREEL